GVERDDEAECPELPEVAHGDGERAPIGAEDELVELGQLSALALPAHPDSLGGIPLPVPVEQVEGGLLPVAVARLELAHSSLRGGDDLRIARTGLRRRVGEVAENDELEVRAPVGQELHLEVLQRALDGADVREERGHHHGSRQLGWDGRRLEEVELGKASWRQELRDQLLKCLQGELVRRDEPEKKNRRPGLPGGRAREPEQEAEANRRPDGHAETERQTRMSAHAAAKALGERWSGLEEVLQLVEALVDQEPSHVSPG